MAGSSSPRKQTHHLIETGAVITGAFMLPVLIIRLMRLPGIVIFIMPVIILWIINTLMGK